MEQQRRFILAMILSAAVIFVWQVLFIEPPEDPDEDEITQVEQQVDEQHDPDQQVDQPDVVDQDDEVAQPDPDDETDQPDEVDQPDEIAEPDPVDVDERRDVIQTNNLTVRLSNRGAVVKNAEIIEPQQYATGSGGDLMRALEPDAPGWPFEFGAEQLELEGDEMFEVLEDDSQRVEELEDTDLLEDVDEADLELYDDGGVYEQITYRSASPDGNYVVYKTYSINEDVTDDEQFSLQLDVEIESRIADGMLAGEPQLDVFAREDPDKEDRLLDFRPDLLEGVCQTTEDDERTALENLEVYEEYAQHHVFWAGTDTRYFITAALPVDGATACSFDVVDGEYLRTRIYHDSFTIGPGDSFEQSYLLYMGPKHLDMLRETHEELGAAVDYGLFSFLAHPLRWSLVQLHNFTLNWGLAIILLTFIIKMLLWPITGKAYRSTEKMKQLQPQIKEIREKYEDDQQRMTEETMKLFRENDASPLGCLPLLLQLPILYGLFVMIFNSVELYQAEFLWYADLSAPDPYFALPVVMGVVMFFQQKITMSASAATTGNKQMKIVMKIMPVAFTGFMLFLPAGLVLYYLLNLLIGLLQQFLIKRKFRKAEEAGEEV